MGVEKKKSPASRNVLHHDDTAETCFALSHMLIGFIGLVERKFFNHAVDALQFGKIDNLFAVQCMARRPTVDGQAKLDHWTGVNFGSRDGCLITSKHQQSHHPEWVGWVPFEYWNGGRMLTHGSA